MPRRIANVARKPVRRRARIAGKDCLLGKPFVQFPKDQLRVDQIALDVAACLFVGMPAFLILLDLLAPSGVRFLV